MLFRCRLDFYGAKQHVVSLPTSPPSQAGICPLPRPPRHQQGLGLACASLPQHSTARCHATAERCRQALVQPAGNIIGARQCS
jgi:hypothetical protein